MRLLAMGSLQPREKRAVSWPTPLAPNERLVSAYFPPDSVVLMDLRPTQVTLRNPTEKPNNWYALAALTPLEALIGGSVNSLLGKFLRR